MLQRPCLQGGHPHTCLRKRKVLDPLHGGLDGALQGHLVIGELGPARELRLVEGLRQACGLG